MKKKNAISQRDLLVGATVISSIALRNYVYLLYCIQFIMIILCGKQLVRHVNKRYFLNTFAFYAASVFSVIWAKDKGRAMDAILSTSQICLLCVMMTGYLRSIRDVEKYIAFFAIAVLVLTVNALISTPLSEWRYIISYGGGEYVNRATDKARLGTSVGLHTNALGISMAVCLISTVYLWKSSRKKWNLVLAVLAIVMIMLSKSRAAMLDACLAIGMFYILLSNKRAKILKRIFLAALGGIVAIWMAIKIPALYKLFGYRISGAVTLILGGSADASTTERMELIKTGLSIFADNPLLGVGINNYRIVAYEKYGAWTTVSAHNTYVEILANTGIVGFIAYYAIRIYTLMVIFRCYKKHDKRDTQRHQFLAFLLSSMIMLMVMDCFNITYDKEAIQYMQMVCIVAANSMLIKECQYTETEYQISETKGNG